MKIHLAVHIDTSQGVFKRTNQTPITVATTGTVWEPNAGVLLYPDRRATKMRIYALDGSDYRLVKTFELTPSKTDNYSFVLVDSIDLAVFESAQLLPVDGYNDNYHVRLNQVKASETSQPFVFLAERSYSIGQSSNEEISGFAVNTLEVSQGQFGQFPLYILCKHSIWALEQGRDSLLAFQNITPVSLNHGVDSPKQFTNIGRSIALIYNDGLFLLSGSDTPEIGRAISNYPNKDLIDFQSVVLSSRRRDSDDEILLSNAQKTYVYNTTFKRWYTLASGRVMWFKANGRTYSVDSSGNIYDEHTVAGGSVPFKIEYDPIHFLSAESLKRMYAAYVRGSVNCTITVRGDQGKVFSSSENVLRMRSVSAYDFTVVVEGTMTTDNEYIEGITAQVEARYPHKNRVYAS